jgi:tetraacyldisaccharide 4'-kinase
MSGRARVEHLLRRTWQQRGVLACLLLPLSLLLRALVSVRRLAFQRGWLRTHTLPVPVIVVGNVIAGGAGKTPMTLWLVEQARRRGWRPGIISRGHGRSGDGVVHVAADSDPATVGDEPLLVHRRTGAPVCVSRNRHAAGQALIARHPTVDLLISDDGLQHLALARDLEICVFDGRGIGNGWLLPAGPLREPWPRAVDLCVQSGAETNQGTAVPRAYRLERRLADIAHPADGSSVTLSDLAATPLVAVAGIAQPERFFDDLRGRGLTLADTQAWPDHHAFDGWQAPAGTVVVCTEKDAVKLWRHHPAVLAVPVEIIPDPALTQAVNDCLDRLRARSRSL